MRPLLLALMLAAAPAVAQAAATIPATAPISEGIEVVMVDRIGCRYCDAFKAEVLPGYAAHPAGQAAPLRIVPMAGPWPDGVALDRAPRLTPTFLLLRGGTEVARIEGYPGAAHFWDAMGEMLTGAGVAY